MNLGFRLILAVSLFLAVVFGYVTAEIENETPQKRVAPRHYVGSNIIDGSGRERILTFEDLDTGKGGRSGGARVTVSTVALFTLAMAAATGLGAVPFFFIELDPQWAGLCNGMAAGVMLAASFDLIQEGQEHGAGNWVMIGILSGGLFILLCKKVMSHFFQFHFQ